MSSTERLLSLPVALDAKRLIPAVCALLLGTTIIFGVALANSDTVHNAAHDTRHAAAFPCH